VAMHSAVSPPLVLDNLGTLKERTAESELLNGASSHTAAGVVAALVFLGAASLVVLVVMLSLLQIAGGVRLWTPAVVAVAASLFLALFVLSPDRAAPRAVAFLPYRQPAAPDEEGLELGRKLKDDLAAMAEEETIDSLQMKAEVGEELKRKLDVRSDHVVDYDSEMADEQEHEGVSLRATDPTAAPRPQPAAEPMAEPMAEMVREESSERRAGGVSADAPSAGVAPELKEMAVDREESLEVEPKSMPAPTVAPADRAARDETLRPSDEPPKGVPALPLYSKPEAKPMPEADSAPAPAAPMPMPEASPESAEPAEPTAAPMPKKPESLDMADSVAIPGAAAKKLVDKKWRGRAGDDVSRHLGELRGGLGASRRSRQLEEPFGDRYTAYSYRRESFAYAGAPRDARSNRAKTVYWAPLLETDADGTAEAEFTLSDAVTKYRIVANAHGAGRLGTAIDTLNSDLPLHLQPTLPSVVTVDDRFSVPLVVGGEAAKAEDLNIEVESTGPIQCGEAKEVTVGRDDSPTRRFSIPVEAGAAAGETAIVFRAEAAGHADAVRKTVQVELRGYPAVQSFGGMLSGRKELTVDLPGDLVADSLNAELVLLPSPAADLEWYADSLDAGTFDQTVALMSVSQRLLDYLETHRIADPDLMRAAKQRLTGARRRLEAFRVSAQAFSTVEGGLAEVAATAQAMLALVRASDALGGEQIAVDRSGSWLKERLEEDRTESLEAEAWAVWALAEAEQPGAVSHLNDLSERMDDQGEPRLLAIAALAAERLNEQETVERLRASLPGHLGDANVEAAPLGVFGWIEQRATLDRESGELRWLRAISPADGDVGLGRDSTLALLAPTRDQFARGPATGSGTVVVRQGERLLAESVIAQSDVRPVVLGGLDAELAEGENALALELSGRERLPYLLVVRYRQTARPAAAENCPVELTTELASLQAAEGGTVRLAVQLANTSDGVLPRPVVQVGLPAGLELSTAVLDGMKKSGRIAAYEIAPRRVTLHWQSLEAGAVAELDVELSASLCGSFTGPASSAWLQDSPQARCWAEPLVIKIVERE
jgi:alpha-2-macroglobulin-like protein